MGAGARESGTPAPGEHPLRRETPHAAAVGAGVRRSAALFGGLSGEPVASMLRYARSLCSALEDADWEARLIHGRTLPVAGPRATRFASLELSRHVAYPQQARRVRANVYHITDHSFGHLVDALPARHTIVTCHDLMPWTVPEIFARRLGRTVGLPLWEKSVRAMARAAHVICVSHRTLRDVEERLGIPRDRMSVIPLGVDETFQPLPAHQRQAAREANDFPDDACVVLHVGHGAPYKNVEQVIRVVHRLRADGVNAVFVKVGRVTPEQHALMESLGIPASAFRLVSGITDETLNRYYNMADVVLFPSRYEGFGLPALEAMRAGVPLVISQAEALVEVTGGRAPSFALDDVDGMAHAVRALWERRACRDDDTRAAVAHAAAFTWRRTAREHAALYERFAA